VPSDPSAAEPTVDPRAVDLRVVAVDHVVLNVADAERALAFYCDALGLAPVRADEWRRGEVPFPSVRVTPSFIVDLLETARTGVNTDHVCLVVEPTDLAAVAASGRFTVVDGPAARFGARGTGTSLYVLDPDGNTVELRHY
jgi:catechol 2,3-dioxygenase-like lactoylglutathione lyase family enzyme